MDRNSPFTEEQKLQYFGDERAIKRYEDIDKCFRDNNIIKHCDGCCIQYIKTCTELYSEDEPHKKCELIKIDDISDYMAQFGATIVRYDGDVKEYSDRLIVRYYYHHELYKRLGLYEIYRAHPEYFR